MGPALASAAGTHTCSGTLKSPGLLVGNYSGDVVIKGACAVNGGPVRVVGDLTVSKGGALIAAFGLNHRTHKGGSSLRVDGDLVVGKNAFVAMGCNPSSFPCIDDNQHKPKRTSADRVSGDVIETAPLGVLIHNATIGGDFTATGGGGGLTCNPPKSGPFAQFKSPVYSALEDSSVNGDATFSGVKSCWLGMARVHVGGNASFVNNKLADPDAIEIVLNHIDKNLSCHNNSAVWDSAETSMNTIFPRTLQRNKVNGARSGQCVLSTPVTMGGPSGPGPF
jgi:hypothetical protein